VSRVAVILPIYNQERWLGRALDSLIAQTDREFIAVCVDDGSTDRTPEILAEYGRRQNLAMRIVRQANAGVSAARNAGLETALAMPDVDAVMFLDPDDRYAPTCVEKARRARAADPEAVVEWTFARAERAVSAFSDRDRLEPNVWCKLYPRATVADVRFFEDSNIAEDLAFNLTVEHRHHPAVVRIDEPLYFYEDNADSVMHRPLTAVDFKRRSAIVGHIVSVFEDDAAALDAVCRDEIPELLKQFWRDLQRVPPTETAEARRIFGQGIRDLRQRRLLHPKRGRLKDLKYYLRFRYGLF